MNDESKLKFGEKIVLFLNVFPNTFRSMAEVEKWLADSLRDRGYEATKARMGGVENSRLLDIYIKPIDKMLIATRKQSPGRPVSIQGNITRLREHSVNPRERDFKKGKMLVRKGYKKNII